MFRRATRDYPFRGGSGPTGIKASANPGHKQTANYIRPAAYQQKQFPVLLFVQWAFHSTASFAANDQVGKRAPSAALWRVLVRHREGCRRECSPAIRAVPADESTLDEPA
jgi:hypothetical protein